MPSGVRCTSRVPTELARALVSGASAPLRSRRRPCRPLFGVLRFPTDRKFWRLLDLVHGVVWMDMSLVRVMRILLWVSV